MLGIGLGAAAKGFERGIGLGRELRADRKLRANEKAQKAIDTAGRAEFDADVAAGKEKTDNWSSFYSRVIVPRKVDQMVTAGDLDGAERFRAWAEQDGNRRGGKLFATGMLKGQAGDMKGALGDFIAAGKIKGYGADFEIGDAEEIKGTDGTVTGYRIGIKGPDGQDYSQTFGSADEILRFGATYLNPISAYEEWDATQKAAASTKAELAKKGAELDLKTADDLKRKGLGLGLKEPSVTDRLKAREMAGEELGVTEGWDELPDDQKEERIQQRTTDLLGTAASPSAPAAPARPQVVVDSRTGQPVAAPLGNALTKGDPLGNVRGRPEVTGIIGAGLEPPIPRPRPVGLGR